MKIKLNQSIENIYSGSLDKATPEHLRKLTVTWPGRQRCQQEELMFCYYHMQDLTESPCARRLIIFVFGMRFVKLIVQKPKEGQNV